MDIGKAPSETKNDYPRNKTKKGSASPPTKDMITWYRRNKAAPHWKYYVGS